MMGDRQGVPLPHRGYNLHIILVGASHPGNLGAVCRSMLNYGFDSLRLVSPTCSPDDIEARNRAKHAGRILDKCEVFESLEQATADCSLTIGTSGKREIGAKTTFRHFMYPWEMTERLKGFTDSVSLVFGEEGKGLSTESLGFCDFLVTLPTWEGYPIANLSHAVNACVYELHRSIVQSSQGNDPGMPDIVPLERSINPTLKGILHQGIIEMGQALPGNDERRESFSHNLRRGIMRSMPTEDEATRLIGGILDATTALQYVSGNSEWKSQRRRKITPVEEE
ncbi:MAG: RNA methyltransferase [Euryarchaeota archaeon]|jgi:TrmH family RNA methyltransferase|nr:RNA methyltransferase [Euryarchaeota archaeon]MBT5843974.1 RNA methyltransferase [Euryarchaeota archaeon]MBT6845145.1 RNA methyltransferase [Euryarchaeota archaeon]MBT7064574.1 RNA methyltransferase [Euryarchaeota archaeon]MBT7638001.1 RNA methyltransferase [Euryarchaeota archaeon]